MPEDARKRDALVCGTREGESSLQVRFRQAAFLPHFGQEDGARIAMQGVLQPLS